MKLNALPVCAVICILFFVSGINSNPADRRPADRRLTQDDKDSEPPKVKDVNCTAMDGIVPVPIYNSPYTILPNKSICCPFEAYHSNGESKCIDTDRVNEHCRQQGRGYHFEPCSYCKTCTKLAGETCRGLQLIHGHCDPGLECLGGNETHEGVCRKIGGPEVKKVGEKCGGRLDSLGVCQNGLASCDKMQTGESICVMKAKTRGFNQTCGGAYGSVGRCRYTLRCTADEDAFLSGAEITGMCYKSSMKVCFKNCSNEHHGPGYRLCGTDGTWYPSNCFRKQRNCGLPNKQHHLWVLKTKESDIQGVCGEEPTQAPTQAPVPTPAHLIPAVGPVEEEDSSSNTEEEDTPTNEEAPPM